MPIAEDSAGGSPVPIPTNLTTNLTGEATGSGTLDYTTGDIDIAVTVVDNGHNHILENITDVQVNNAISGQVLKYNGNVWVNGTDENAGITAIVQDLTPQLGGNLDLNNRNITGTGNIAITGTIDGRDVSADGTKLDGIESGATADQTAAQIKTAYESNANTNNFADADVSKLSGIEPGATADQTAAQIKTAYESNADTNAFTDADHTKLDGIETAADVTDTTNVVASLTAGTNVTISAGGVISSTASGGLAHVVDDTTPQLGGNLDLNINDITGTGNLNFTGSVTLSGTVDGRDVAADGTKLDGIEASADVTDTANVTAAGALMDSEVTNLAQVKAFDSSDYATAAQGTTADAALPKAGGTMTGDILFNDGVKAKYGTSSDLQIYHDGSNSYISDTGTGDVIVKGQYIRLQDEVGTNLLTADGNDAVSLYFGGASKLATTTSGIDVTGTLQVEGATGETIRLHRDDTTVSGGNLIGQIAFSHNDDTNSGDGVLIKGIANGGIGNTTLQIHTGTPGSLTEKIRISDSKVENKIDLEVTGTTKTNGTGYNPANTQWATNAALITTGSYGGGLTFIDGSKAYSFHTLSGGEVLTIKQGATSGALTEKLRIDADGLDVTGNVNATGNIDATGTISSGAMVIENSGGYGNIEIGGGSGAYIDLKSPFSDDYDFRIITVGTSTTMNGQSGNLILQRAGSSKLTVTTSGIDVTGSTITTGTSGTTQWQAGSSANKLTIASYDNNIFYHKLSSGNSTSYQVGVEDNIPIYTITNNSVKTTLLGNGNFGVGLTAPTAKMHLFTDGIDQSMFSAQADLGVQNRILTLKSPVSDSTTQPFRWQTSNSILWEIDGTESKSMNLNSVGNLGLGTYSPSSKLSVVGDILLDSDNAEINLKSGITGTSGAVNWTFNTTTTNYASLNLNYDTRATTGFHIDSGYPITIDSSGIGTIFAYGGTEQMRLSNTGRLGIGTTSPNHELHIESTSPTIRLVDTDGNNTVDFSQSGSATYIDFDNNVRFRNLANAERLRIDTGGIDVTGNATISNALYVGGANATNSGYIESTVVGSSRALQTVGNVNTTQTHIGFENLSGEIGRIDVSAFSVAYVTSSDYRLKTDIQPMQGSIDRVKALNPVNFEWTGDGSRVDGFIAHEAQEVVPEAISGEKDAMRDQEYVESEATGDIYTSAVQATYETIQVELTPAVDATYDEDGNELTPAVDATYEEQQQELTPAVDEVIHSSDVVEPDELEEGQRWRETTEKVMATRQVPDYQGIDQSKIVPLLTSALQDAIAKIEALETRLEALES